MNFSKTKKLIAMSVAICVFFSEITYAAPGISLNEASLKTEITQQTVSASNLKLPADLGTLERIFIPKTADQSRQPFIFHIQAIHSDYETATKIREIIQCLQEQYGVKTIFAEGAGEALRPEFLEFSKQPESNAKIIEALAKKGELTGVDLALASSKPALKVLGIEDIYLYRKAFRLFRKVAENLERSTQEVDAQKLAIDKKASAYLNPELKKLIRNWFRFQRHQQDLMTSLIYLRSKAREDLNLDFENPYSQFEWPQLTRLVVLQEAEKRFEEGKLEEQIKLLKVWLEQHKLSTGFIDWLKSEGGISSDLPRTVIEAFLRQSIPQGFQFRDYPQIIYKAVQRVLESELDARLLFLELNHLYEQLLEKNTHAQDERGIIDEYKQLLLLQKLLSLELSPEEWAEIKTADWASGREGEGELNTLQSAIRFYRLMEQRESAFFQKIQNTMNPASNSISREFSPRTSVLSPFLNHEPLVPIVLVTGGFHAAGMSRYFHDHQMGYAVISPHLSGDVDQSVYRKIMLRGAGMEKPLLAQPQSELRALLGSEASGYLSAELEDVRQAILDAGFRVDRHAPFFQDRRSYLNPDGLEAPRDHDDPSATADKRSDQNPNGFEAPRDHDDPSATADKRSDQNPDGFEAPRDHDDPRSELRTEQNTASDAAGDPLSALFKKYHDLFAPPVQRLFSQDLLVDWIRTAQTSAPELEQKINVFFEQAGTKILFGEAELKAHLEQLKAEILQFVQNEAVLPPQTVSESAEEPETAFLRAAAAAGLKTGNRYESTKAEGEFFVVRNPVKNTQHGWVLPLRVETPGRKSEELLLQPQYFGIFVHSVTPVSIENIQRTVFENHDQPFELMTSRQPGYLIERSVQTVMEDTVSAKAIEYQVNETGVVGDEIFTIRILNEASDESAGEIGILRGNISDEGISEFDISTNKDWRERGLMSEAFARALKPLIEPGRAVDGVLGEGNTILKLADMMMDDPVFLKKLGTQRLRELAAARTRNRANKVMAQILLTGAVKDFGYKFSSEMIEQTVMGKLYKKAGLENLEIYTVTLSQGEVELHLRGTAPVYSPLIAAKPEDEGLLRKHLTGEREADLTVDEDLWNELPAEVHEKIERVIAEYRDKWQAGDIEREDGFSEEKRAVKIAWEGLVGDEEMDGVIVSGVLFDRDNIGEDFKGLQWGSSGQSVDEVDEALLKEQAINPEVLPDGRPNLLPAEYAQAGGHGGETAVRKARNARTILPARGLRTPVAVGYALYTPEHIQKNGKPLGVFISFRRKKEKRFSHYQHKAVRGILSGYDQALHETEQQALATMRETVFDPTEVIPELVKKYDINHLSEVYGRELRKVIDAGLYPHSPHFANFEADPLGRWQTIWHDLGGWKIREELTPEQAFGYAYMTLSYAILTLQIRFDHALPGYYEAGYIDPYASFLKGFFHDQLQNPDFDLGQFAFSDNGNNSLSIVAHDVTYRDDPMSLPPLYQRLDAPFVKVLRTVMGMPVSDEELANFRPSQSGPVVHKRTLAPGVDEEEWPKPKGINAHRTYREMRSQTGLDAVGPLIANEFIVPQLKQIVEQGSLEDVVEYGAGAGTLWDWAHDGFKDWFGRGVEDLSWLQTDANLDALRMVSRYPKRVMPIDLKMAPIPLSEQSAALSWAGLDILPVPELPAVVRDIAATLKPGGKLIVGLDMGASIEIEAYEAQRNGWVAFPYFTQISFSENRPSGMIYVDWETLKKKYKPGTALAKKVWESLMPYMDMYSRSAHSAGIIVQQAEATEASEKQLMIIAGEFLKIARQTGTLKHIAPSRPALHIERIKLAAEAAGFTVDAHGEISRSYTVNRSDIPGLNLSVNQIIDSDGMVAQRRNPKVRAGMVQVDIKFHLLSATKTGEVQKEWAYQPLGISQLNGGRLDKSQEPVYEMPRRISGPVRMDSAERQKRILSVLREELNKNEVNKPKKKFDLETTLQQLAKELSEHQGSFDEALVNRFFGKNRLSFSKPGYGALIASRLNEALRQFGRNANRFDTPRDHDDPRSELRMFGDETEPEDENPADNFLSAHPEYPRNPDAFDLLVWVSEQSDGFLILESLDELFREELIVGEDAVLMIRMIKPDGPTLEDASWGMGSLAAMLSGEYLRSDDLHQLESRLSGIDETRNFALMGFQEALESGLGLADVLSLFDEFINVGTPRAGLMLSSLGTLLKQNLLTRDEILEHLLPLYARYPAIEESEFLEALTRLLVNPVVGKERFVGFLEPFLRVSANAVEQTESVARLVAEGNWTPEEVHQYILPVSQATRGRSIFLINMLAAAVRDGLLTREEILRFVVPLAQAFGNLTDHIIFNDQPDPENVAVDESSGNVAVRIMSTDEFNAFIHRGLFADFVAKYRDQEFTSKQFLTELLIPLARKKYEALGGQAGPVAYESGHDLRVELHNKLAAFINQSMEHAEIVLEQIKQLYREEDVQRRYVLILAISQAKLQMGRRALEAFFFSETNVMLQKTVLQGIGEMGFAESLPFLEELQQNTSYEAEIQALAQQVHQQIEAPRDHDDPSASADRRSGRNANRFDTPRDHDDPRSDLNPDGLEAPRDHDDPRSELRTTDTDKTPMAGEPDFFQKQVGETNPAIREIQWLDPEPGPVGKIELTRPDGTKTIYLQIASGGSGAVFQARQPDPVTGRRDILKMAVGTENKLVVTTQQLSEEKRLSDEITRRSAEAGISRPSASRILNGGMVSMRMPSGTPVDRYMLEIEEAPGQIVLKELLAQGKLTAAEKLDILTSVIREALSLIALEIIPRDFKPSNILVSETPDVWGKRSITLIDAGLYFDLNSTKAQKKKTLPKAASTTGYMPRLSSANRLSDGIVNFRHGDDLTKEDFINYLGWAALHELEGVLIADVLGDDAERSSGASEHPFAGQNVNQTFLAKYKPDDAELRRRVYELKDRKETTEVEAYITALKSGHNEPLILDRYQLFIERVESLAAYLRKRYEGVGISENHAANIIGQWKDQEIKIRFKDGGERIGILHTIGTVWPLQVIFLKGGLFPYHFYMIASVENIRTGETVFLKRKPGARINLYTGRSDKRYIGWVNRFIGNEEHSLLLEGDYPAEEVERVLRSRKRVQLYTLRALEEPEDSEFGIYIDRPVTEEHVIQETLEGFKDGSIAYDPVTQRFYMVVDNAMGLVYQDHMRWAVFDREGQKLLGLIPFKILKSLWQEGEMSLVNGLDRFDGTEDEFYEALDQELRAEGLIQIRDVDDEHLRRYADHPVLIDSLLRLKALGLWSFESHFGGESHSRSLPADQTGIIVTNLNRTNREILSEHGFLLPEPEYAGFEGMRKKLQAWDPRRHAYIGFARNEKDSPEETGRIEKQWDEIIGLLTSQVRQGIRGGRLASVRSEHKSELRTDDFDFPWLPEWPQHIPQRDHELDRQMFHYVTRFNQSLRPLLEWDEASTRLSADTVFELVQSWRGLFNEMMPEEVMQRFPRPQSFEKLLSLVETARGRTGQWRAMVWLSFLRSLLSEINQNRLLGRGWMLQLVQRGEIGSQKVSITAVRVKSYDVGTGDATPVVIAAVEDPSAEVIPEYAHAMTVAGLPILQVPFYILINDLKNERIQNTYRYFKDLHALFSGVTDTSSPYINRFLSELLKTPEADFVRLMRQLLLHEEWTHVHDFSRALKNKAGRWALDEQFRFTFGEEKSVSELPTIMSIVANLKGLFGIETDFEINEIAREAHAYLKQWIAAKTREQKLVVVARLLRLSGILHHNDGTLREVHHLPSPDNVHRLSAQAVLAAIAIESVPYRPKPKSPWQEIDTLIPLFLNHLSGHAELRTDLDGNQTIPGRMHERTNVTVELLQNDAEYPIAISHRSIYFQARKVIKAGLNRGLPIVILNFDPHHDAYEDAWDTAARWKLDMEREGIGKVLTVLPVDVANRSGGLAQGGQFRVPRGTWEKKDYRMIRESGRREFPELKDVEIVLDDGRTYSLQNYPGLIWLSLDYDFFSLEDDYHVEPDEAGRQLALLADYLERNHIQMDEATAYQSWDYVGPAARAEDNHWMSLLRPHFLSFRNRILTADQPSVESKALKDDNQNPALSSESIASRFFRYRWSIAAFIAFAVLFQHHVFIWFFSHFSAWLAVQSGLALKVLYLSLAAQLGSMFLGFFPFARLVYPVLSYERAEREAQKIYDDVLAQARERGDLDLEKALLQINGFTVLPTSLAHPLQSFANYGKVLFGGKDRASRKILLTRELLLPLPFLSQPARYIFIRRALGFDYDIRGENFMAGLQDQDQKTAAFSVKNALWWIYGDFQLLRRFRYFPVLLPYLIFHPAIFVNVGYLAGLFIVPFMFSKEKRRAVIEMLALYLTPENDTVSAERGTIKGGKHPVKARADELQELIALVDEHGTRTRQSKSKSEVHRDGDWHLTAQIMLVDPMGNMIFQKRSSDRKISAGKLQMGVSGHVDDGDTDVAAAALREAGEELGIHLNKSRLLRVGNENSIKRSYRSGDVINNEFTTLYVYQLTESEMDQMQENYNLDEIEQFEILPVAFFEQMIRNQPKLFSNSVRHLVLNEPGLYAQVKQRLRSDRNVDHFESPRDHDDPHSDRNVDHFESPRNHDDSRSELRMDEADVPTPPFANREEFLVAFGIAREKLGDGYTPQQMAAEIGWGHRKTLYRMLRRYGFEDAQQFLKDHGAKVRVSKRPQTRGFGDGDLEQFLIAYDEARVDLGDGYTPTQMAKELGYAGASSLRNRITRYGFDARVFMRERGAKIQRTWEEFERDYGDARQKLGDGYSPDEIAQAMGYKNESALRRQMSDAGLNPREYMEERGANLRKKPHEGGRLAFVRQMDKLYKVLGPDALMEEYAARMGYDNINSFNSSLQRYGITFRDYIRSKGDLDVPLATSELGEKYAGSENLLRHIDRVLAELPREPGFKTVSDRLGYAHPNSLRPRLRQMGYPKTGEFMAERSRRIHDRLDFERKLQAAVSLLRPDYGRSSASRWFERLTSAMGFQQPYEFFSEAYRLQADLTTAGFSSALNRKAGILAGLVTHHPHTEEQRAIWIRTLLRLERTGVLSSKAVYALIYVSKQNQPFLSKGTLNEIENYFHIDLEDLLGARLFEPEGTFSDALDFLVSVGNQKRELELNTGRANPKPILQIIEKHMPAYFEMTGLHDEVPFNTPLSRDFLLWLRHGHVLQTESSENPDYPDAARLANLLLFRSNEIPPIAGDYPESISARQAYVRNYFLGKAINDPAIAAWLEEKPGPLEILAEALAHPQVSDKIEDPDFSLQVQAQKIAAARFNMDDLLQRYGTTSGAEPAKAFWDHLEALSISHNLSDLTTLVRDLRKQLPTPEMLQAAGYGPLRMTVGWFEHLQVSGPDDVASQMLNTMALAAAEFERLMPTGHFDEFFLRLIREWKKRAQSSAKARFLLNAWLFRFAELAQTRLSDEPLQQLYDQVIMLVFDGIQIARSNRSVRASFTRKKRLVLQEQKFDILWINRRHEEHLRRLSQQREIMLQIRGENQTQTDEWDAYVKQFIIKNYSGFFKSGVTDEELHQASLTALARMAYDYGYEGNIFEYLIEALKPETNPVKNDEIQHRTSERITVIDADIEKYKKHLETQKLSDKEKLRYESRIAKREAERKLAESALEMQGLARDQKPFAEAGARIGDLQREFDRLAREQGFIVYLKWELARLWKQHKKMLNLDKAVRTESLDAGAEGSVLYRLLEDSAADGDFADWIEGDESLPRQLYEELVPEVLDDLESRIFHLYHRVDPVYTYADIAYQLGFEGVTETVLSRERIHQLFERAQTKIKNAAYTRALKSWNEFIERLGARQNPDPRPLPLKWPEKPGSYVLIGDFLPLVSVPSFSDKDFILRLESSETQLMRDKHFDEIRQGIHKDAALQAQLDEMPMPDSEAERPELVTVRMRDGTTRQLNLAEIEWEDDRSRTYLHSLTVSIRSMNGKVVDVQEIELITKPDGSIHPLYVTSLRDEPVRSVSSRTLESPRDHDDPSAAADRHSGRNANRFDTPWDHDDPHSDRNVDHFESPWDHDDPHSELRSFEAIDEKFGIRLAHSVYVLSDEVIRRLGRDYAYLADPGIFQYMSSGGDAVHFLSRLKSLGYHFIPDDLGPRLIVGSLGGIRKSNDLQRKSTVFLMAFHEALNFLEHEEDRLSLILLMRLVVPLVSIGTTLPSMGFDATIETIQEVVGKILTHSTPQLSKNAGEHGFDLPGFVDHWKNLYESFDAMITAALQVPFTAADQVIAENIFNAFIEAERMLGPVRFSADDIERALQSQGEQALTIQAILHQFLFWTPGDPVRPRARAVLDRVKQKLDERSELRNEIYETDFPGTLTGKQMVLYGEGGAAQSYRILLAWDKGNNKRYRFLALAPMDGEEQNNVFILKIFASEEELKRVPVFSGEYLVSYVKVHDAEGRQMVLSPWQKPPVRFLPADSPSEDADYVTNGRELSFSLDRGMEMLGLLYDHHPEEYAEIWSWLVYSVFEALRELSQHGFFYYDDIRPNLWVTEDNQGHVIARLGDFEGPEPLKNLRKFITGDVDLVRKEIAKIIEVFLQYSKHSTPQSTLLENVLRQVDPYSFKNGTEFKRWISDLVSQIEEVGGFKSELRTSANAQAPREEIASVPTSHLPAGVIPKEGFTFHSFSALDLPLMAGDGAALMQTALAFQTPAVPAMGLVGGLFTAGIGPQVPVYRPFLDRVVSDQMRGGKTTDEMAVIQTAINDPSLDGAGINTPVKETAKGNTVLFQVMLKAVRGADRSTLQARLKDLQAGSVVIAYDDRLNPSGLDLGRMLPAGVRYVRTVYENALDLEKVKSDRSAQTKQDETLNQHAVFLFSDFDDLRFGDASLKEDALESLGFVIRLQPEELKRQPRAIRDQVVSAIAGEALEYAKLDREIRDEWLAQNSGRGLLGLNGGAYSVVFSSWLDARTDQAVSAAA
ncbi:MAG: NUDIX domain-containing protein [Candidatus Omnitrophica bacterium]|nr:NUDIX domain-containing protein [Candidatus Omnitrophota bacterium]